MGESNGDIAFLATTTHVGADAGCPVQQSPAKPIPVLAQFELSHLQWVILSLRRIWRAADLHSTASRGATREVLQDLSPSG